MEARGRGLKRFILEPLGREVGFSPSQRIGHVLEREDKADVYLPRVVRGCHNVGPNKYTHSESLGRNITIRGRLGISA